MLFQFLKGNGHCNYWHWPLGTQKLKYRATWLQNTAKQKRDDNMYAGRWNYAMEERFVELWIQYSSFIMFSKKWVASSTFSMILHTPERKISCSLKPASVLKHSFIVPVLKSKSTTIKHRQCFWMKPAVSVIQ